jgi:ATP-dependent helicase HrpA
VPFRSSQRALARSEERALLPRPLYYPDELPIAARKDEIVAALTTSQVLVVAGETGSGKSTQLPKMCLEAGRGEAGMIGHTQPRRLAARSIAERVAEELGTTLGRAVGYKVRFTDRVSDSTLVKVMTDGILLAELHSDPELRSYDTLIIDEAHERSLNIDFILGYLKRLLPSRPDLKVIITSATIDTERFSRHFDDARVIEVAGRTYPVEIRYRPLAEEGEENSDEEPMDEVQAVCDAVAELAREGPGDILVFLPGEREIRDTAEALDKADLKGLDVLSLYGRLSSAEQHRIFEPHTGRRAVLSTNVAETSLTVPGIRYVVDLGTARISRYGRRTKVQRLPIERISQASANQRAGRCGRLGPGVCVRLYSEEDFASRRPFTEPEILRTNLASVILQMAAIGLGDIENFPFMEPPDRRNIADGVALLEELGAFATDPGVGPDRDGAGPAERHPSRATPGEGARLSAVGRKLAQLPLDPRLGRMVIEAGRLGCLEDVLVIASGLSVQDPRERPAEKREAAAALHARFADESSDFMSFLHLWQYLDQRQGELSSSQFRRLCRRELISYQRAREWQDVHGQLVEIAGQIRLGQIRLGQIRLGQVRSGQVGSRQLKRGGRADSGEGQAHPPAGHPSGADGSGRARRAEVHQALLSGLVTQVGLREGERADFAAPRGARFAIWPGSVLAKKSPRWVMAAELVETSRLWARVVAPVRPQWVERAAAHLLKWSYSDPEWDATRAGAFVLARATLYGLPIVAGRRLELSRLDRDGARDMFIRYALVDGDWDEVPAFVGQNRDLVDESQALLQRARRHEPLAGEDALFEFYASRVGPEVTSGQAFWAWSRRDCDSADRLVATPEELWGPSLVDVDLASFPDVWTSAGTGPLALRYEWDPGTEDDGVHVEVPLAQLGKLAGERLEWQVPGLREELVVALLRSLPKDLRRHLVPVPEHAKEFVAKASPGDGPLLAVLAAHMSAASGTAISARDFDWAKVPAYLRPTFEVFGDDGRTLASGKGLADLYAALQPQLLAALQAAAASASLGGGPEVRHSKWDFGELPKVFEPEWNGARLTGYPALVDEGDSISVQVFPDSASSRAAMVLGTRRLLLLNLPSRRQLVDGLERLIHNPTKLALAGLAHPPYRSTRELAEDAIVACLDEVVAANGGPAWGPDEFETLVSGVRQRVGVSAEQAVRAAVRVISTLQSLGHRTRELGAMAGAGPSPMTAALDDVVQQLAALTGHRFLSQVGLGRLPDLERYLAAIERRLERLPADPRRDLALTQRVRSLQLELEDATAEALVDEAGTAVLHALGEVRWMIEELRVSFFAQSLGTRVPVSEERVRRAITAARRTA